MTIDIKPGDIVTGYHKGYWKVDRRVGSTIYYTRIDKNISKSCHRDYCKIVDPDQLFNQMVREATELRDMLMRAKNEF